MTLDYQPPPVDFSIIVSTQSDDESRPGFTTERRVTPTWSVMQLKAKLETMTGVPPGCQRLLLKALAPGLSDRWIEGGDESTIADWGLVKGCEVVVHDTRPKALRPNFDDVSSVEKYVLPESKYESLPSSVLAWKKNQKLGRFDPTAESPEQLRLKQVEKDVAEVNKRDITLSKRAIILPSSPPHVRRGTIRFIGPVPTIPSQGGSGNKSETDPGIDPLPIWVGIELDEPIGRNDGSIGGRRYFSCPNKRGVFAKPDKVEVGDFPPLGLDDLGDEDMEEI